MLIKKLFGFILLSMFLVGYIRILCGMHAVLMLMLGALNCAVRWLVGWYYTEVSDISQ